MKIIHAKKKNAREKMNQVHIPSLLSLGGTKNRLNNLSGPCRENGE